MRKQKLALLRGQWEIIEIRPIENNPGAFRLWVLVDDSLHAVTVLVPRTFYINSRKTAGAEMQQIGRKVDKYLPRSRPTLNLYEVTMPEKLYVDNYATLEENFADSSIEGVYETKVELLFRAIMKLGCVCSVTKEARSKRVKVFT